MTIPFAPFKREDHVYSNPAFAEFLKDAVRAFNGSPVAPLPPPTFAGSGVYALYCTATTGPYAKFGKTINRLEYKVPIYVGKAVPPGWRQSRQLTDTEDTSSALSSRLRQHARSIEQGKGLAPKDFWVRKMVFPLKDWETAAVLSRALIACYSPLWNTKIRGFSTDGFTGSTSLHSTAWSILHAPESSSSTEKDRLLARIESYLTAIANELAA